MMTLVASGLRSLIPWLVFAAVAYLVIALILRDWRRSYWWRLRTREGVATVYFFYQHGERRNLDALRKFEDVAHNLSDEAEFVGCEHKVQPELAERFEITQSHLPCLVIHWEGVRGQLYASLSCVVPVKEESDLRAMVRDLIAQARGLADAACARLNTEG